MKRTRGFAARINFNIARNWAGAIPDPCVLSWIFHSIKIAPAVAPLTVNCISEISTLPTASFLPILEPRIVRGLDNFHGITYSTMT